ncbi:ricin B-like lectin R40C1 isoform X1 [Cryptomeria japonica]|uniref:ricin B-like lectin R40C1 isoform X1 n=2 Tax=Cryptomeria japonica TaxID=3369 RepID=UPI0027DA3FD9|nr:ricin B-like lectin R40C1 isoform X1 [Cryptomeria japonica]
MVLFKSNCCFLLRWLFDNLIGIMFGHHHHHHDQQQPAPAPYGGAPYPPVSVQGETVKIYCEANPDYHLANFNGHVVMTAANESDPNQQWIMDTAWSVRAKDEAGFPAFALINRATGQALRHGRSENERVILGPYHIDDLNEAVLFAQSADVGRGYQCIRPVNNILINLEAMFQDDKHHRGVHEGAAVALFKWNKKETQKWKISPILGSSHGGSGHRSLYPQVDEEEPRGIAVRIYCEANPNFFMAAQGQLAVLALGTPYDPHQQWIKVDSWGLRVRDEVGYPAFALVNKVTKQALKHGNKEWDQIYLADHNHYKLDKSFLWTQSADVGHGYQCLRPVNNIHLNMDAKGANGETGGIHHGNELILFSWNQQSNQKWKLQPL